MGLTVYYDWKTKTDLSAARRMIVRFHAIAQKLPFDEVSEIYEQDPPACKAEFRKYNHAFRQGELYRPRRRGDGPEETVHVPALHALFFHVHVEGAETASIGLASRGSSWRCGTPASPAMGNAPMAEIRMASSGVKAARH
jgi:hypothetical protein